MKASVIRQLEKNVKELTLKCNESLDKFLSHSADPVKFHKDYLILIIELQDAEDALAEAKDKYLGNV